MTVGCVPRYEYACDECDLEWCLQRSMEDRDNDTECTQCGKMGRRLVSLPAARIAGPAGESYICNGKRYTLDTADDRRRIHRLHGLEDKGIMKESWDRDFTETINENLAKKKEAKKKRGTFKPLELPTPKEQVRRDERMRKKIREAAAKAVKKLTPV